MHVHNGQNIQKIPTKVEIFKISLQIRIVYVPNKTVYRGKFTKIRVACIHGYSGLKSIPNQNVIVVYTVFENISNHCGSDYLQVWLVVVQTENLF